MPSKLEGWLAAMEAETTVAGGAKVLQDFMAQPEPEPDTAVVLFAAFRHLCTVARCFDEDLINQIYKTLDADVLDRAVRHGANGLK